jgi:hypothetical protein
MKSPIQKNILEKIEKSVLYTVFVLDTRSIGPNWPAITKYTFLAFFWQWTQNYNANVFSEKCGGKVFLD